MADHLRRLLARPGRVDGPDRRPDRALRRHRASIAVPAGSAMRPAATTTGRRSTVSIQRTSRTGTRRPCAARHRGGSPWASAPAAGRLEAATGGGSRRAAPRALRRCGHSSLRVTRRARDRRAGGGPLTPACRSRDHARVVPAGSAASSSSGSRRARRRRKQPTVCPSAAASLAEFAPARRHPEDGQNGSGQDGETYWHLVPMAFKGPECRPRRCKCSSTAPCIRVPPRGM